MSQTRSTVDRRVMLVQLGLGGVGQALVKQYLGLSDKRPQDFAWLGYRALGDRSGLLAVNREAGWAREDLIKALGAKQEGKSLAGIAPSFGSDAVFTPAEPGALSSLEAVWKSQGGVSPRAAVVDLTAERQAYDTLLEARKHGAHIIMCNKWTLAESAPRMDAFMAAGPGKVLYETTVGAALPVISTLDSLLNTGDEVHSIEAAISGTMGYVCSEIERGVPFSRALEQAQSLGYTEPDPRDDLAGIDARRKALILARKMGVRIDMADVSVDSLVPEGLGTVSLEEFWKRLPVIDQSYRQRVKEAASRGAVLRFLARIDRQGASVALAETPKSSLAGGLAGTESLFVFNTRRYGDQPLAIRGRGAGADLTASGVMSDILTLKEGEPGV